MLFPTISLPVLRVLLICFLAGVLLAVTPGNGRAMSPPTLDWPIVNGHHFTQASGFPAGTSPMGFALIDDQEAKFWSAFKRLGGVARLGYPASRRFRWRGFVSQLTQKAMLQWRPDTGAVDFVNVFDDLAAAGKNDWLAAARSIPAPLPADYDAGLTWPQIVNHRVSLLRSRQALIAWYQSTPGANDLYGLPTSPVVDAGPMYVIRLQRAVLQEWKVKEPWAGVGQVTVANGGDVAKDAAVFPWRDLRVVDSGQASWPVATASYRMSGVATWYGPGFVGKLMANGQVYDPNDPTTTASNAYPLGSRLKVTDRTTKKTVEVFVRDTGRFAYPDVVDLSPAAFAALGAPTSTGVISVTVQLVATLPIGPTSNTQSPPSP